MEFEKAHFDVKGDTLTLAMPLQKIDESKREVSGFATLDNVDSQGDVVLKEASYDAFARARGNIREMHSPLAVGKLRHFEEKTLYGDDGTIYNGVYVTVYVSKGAEDTWQKVLDGTLSGFSIGGNIIESDTQWVKDAGSNGANVRFIKKYDLIELSLVDNPANQLANVFSIQKSITGETIVKGMVTDVASQNVFYCANGHNGVTDISDDIEATCLLCGNAMALTGVYNTGEEISTEKVGEIVSKFLGTEGGVTEMTNTDIEKSEEVVEPTVAVEETVVVDTEPNQPLAVVESEAPEDAEPVEQAEPVEEVDETEGNDISKMIDNLKASIEKSVADSREIAEEASRKVQEEIAKANDAFNSKVEEIDGKYNELSKKLDEVKSETNETRKSLEILSGTTAFKKSGEVESPEVTTKKSGIFGGVFLSADNE